MHNKHFNIAPSSLLGNWLIAIHLLTGFILLILPVSILFKLIALVLIVWCYFYYKNLTNPIHAFKHQQLDQWFLYDNDNKQYVVSLLKQSFISDFLVILQFSHQQRLILFRQQLTQADWCCLQRLLRS